eukprot:m.216933 g.216933  ORF g.216933 m.216933 type:complete len:66 (+) comp25663_c2_seq5:618-815(+)
MEHVRLGWGGGLVRSGVKVGGEGMKCGVAHAECVKIGNGETGEGFTTWRGWMDGINSGAQWWPRP